MEEKGVEGNKRKKRREGGREKGRRGGREAERDHIILPKLPSWHNFPTPLMPNE